MTFKLQLRQVDRMDHSLQMIREQSVDNEDTLIVTLTFRCNSRCRFCIIEKEIEDALPDTDDEVLRRVLELNRDARQFKRLTLTGAEVTLLDDLEGAARRATQEGGFEVVRIQTNGRKLRDRALVDRLMAAGVREYFVSVHAHTAELDAHVTRAPASFRQMQEGIANLLAAGARVITNTVVTRDNYQHLPAIAAFLLELGVRDAQFWNFIEVGDAAQAEQLVSASEAAPHLLAALETLDAAGATTLVKWFPRCMLGRFADRLDNHQPQMLTRDEFQLRIGENFGFGCVHASRCSAFGRTCDGMHDRHRQVFGDLRDALRPFA